MNEFEILIVDSLEGSDMHQLSFRTLKSEQHFQENLLEAKSHLEKEKKNRSYAIALIIEHIKPGNRKKIVHCDY